MTNSDSRKGGILRGLLLTFLTILLLLVGAGLYLAHNIRVNHGRDQVAIETPGGLIRIEGRDHVNPASLGIPVYPGAERGHDGGRATFSWSSADGAEEKQLAVGGGEFFTPDSPDRVVAFYREQLPNWLIVTERHGDTRLEYHDGGYKRIVHIRSRDSGTQIGVATVGAPAPN